MSTTVIRRVDPADEAAVRAFYEIYLACGRHDLRSFIASPAAELADVMRRPTQDFAYTGYLAYDGETPVGQGWYAEFRRANRDRVMATPRVLPEHRGRGVGSTILAHLEERARVAGRTMIQTAPRWATRHGAQGRGAPSVEFARKHGYSLALVEAKRRLALPVADTLLDELAGRVEAAYRIEAFAGPVPDPWVQGWAELEASLPTEAPTGELETEVNPPSVEAVRDDERVLAASGQVKYNALAFDADGVPVGYTDVVVRGAGEPAEQWGTLVRRAHRGHGLGHGLKAAVLRLLQTERPDVSATITSNGLDNVAMTAVNERLGYEVVEYLGDVTKRL